MIFKRALLYPFYPFLFIYSFFNCCILSLSSTYTHTSDNGGINSTYTSNGELRGYKAHLWEGGVRTVGFLYSESEEIMPNRGLTSCYVHVADWFKTIIGISGRNWIKSR